MDIASAAKHYAQKHKLGKEAVNHAREIEIKAEILLGEFLLEMEKGSSYVKMFFGGKCAAQLKAHVQAFTHGHWVFAFQ